MSVSKKIIKRVESDLKSHNVETIKNILEIYKTSNRCCAIQATGTGKTFLILRLLEIYNDEGKSAVIFAPNREIIKQTKKRMKKFGLNNATFYTYQKLARMTDEEISAMEFDLIVCDELHRTGAKTWGQKFETLVNSHPDSKVFGVTATPLRCADGRDMAEEYFDGNKACDISLAEALVREIIPVMPLYVSALYTFEEEYRNMSEKIANGNNSIEEKAELQKELLAAKQQLEKANGVPEIIKKYITNYNGKYIVFCKDKKRLYAMKDVVIGWFREAGYDGKIFEYPYYSNSSAVKKNLENFENNNEEGLKLLFVIDKLNEGLHLDEVHGCILLRTTVSNIIYYQQIGRAIDAGSAEQRVILDLVFNFNSLKSFNFKKELEKKVTERREGKFAECSKEFEIDKFDVVDLVQDCINVFDEINKQIMGGVRIDFQVGVKHLKEYMKTHRFPPKHYICDDGFNLGSWYSSILQRYTRKTLSKEEIFEIELCGCVFDSKSKSKDAEIYKINLIDEWQQINKTKIIPAKLVYKGENLGSFAKSCRNLHMNKNRLPKWKVDLLNSIGFVWNQRDYIWEQYYLRLVDYYNEHGNSDVGYTKSNSDKQLARWCSAQRKAYFDKTLSDEKIRKLEKLNFIWDIGEVKDRLLWIDRCLKMEKYIALWGI